MIWTWEGKTFDTFYALKSFLDYCNENERLIREAAAEAERLHGPKWHPEDEEEAGEYHEEQRMARHLHDEIVTPVFRYSCVAMLYTVVERELRRLCGNLEQEKGPAKLKYKDLKGGLLEQIPKWCSVCFGLEIASFKEFSEIRDLQKVRDCIVHCNGEVDDSRDKKEILAMKDRYTGFFAWEGTEIEIQPEFVSHMHRQVWNFFLAVFSVLQWNVDADWLAKKF
jgi:hypothetical protein